jgi:hypothetical protein
MNMKHTPYIAFVLVLFGVVFSIDGDVFFMDEHVVLVNILSPSDAEVDDANVRVYAYDEGIVSSVRMDANEGEYDDAIVRFKPSNRGDYEPVRVVLQNDDMREVKHVWTWVG